eukprot:PITA_02055
MFKVNNANQILFLKSKLKDIMMDKGESIQSYFMRITQIKNELLSIGEVISDREHLPIALGGLPRPWDVFVTTILNNYRIPGFDELLARSTQEETRMMERDKPSNGNEPTAFYAHAKRTNNASRRRQGQGFKKGFQGGRKGRCYNCNMFDHYARECSHKKNSPRDDDNNNHNNFKANGNQTNNRFNNKGKRNALVARNGNGRLPKRTRNSRYDGSNIVEKQDEFYLISALSTAFPSDTLDHWLIDNGASRCFTEYKEALSNLVEKKTNLEIILGDNATYPMKGIGIVTLHLNQGQTIHLQVLYVPDLKKKLVSISAMEDKGFKVAFFDGKGCAIGKLTRGPFTSSESKITDILQLVHYDLSSVLLVTSLGGYLYYAIFVDDFSRKIWIYFLKKKDEVFRWFCSFKALVENQTGKKIKISRTDNGTEYESNEFNDFCRDTGTKRETTVPHTLEQNGVAERKN